MFPAGLIAPPANITARWAGAAGQICVSWQPPLADFPNFFLYEVQCCPASSPGMPCSTTLNPSDPSIQSTVSTHTPRAGAASPGAGQVHRGVRDGQGGLRAAAAPQPGSSLQRLVQANTWVVLRGLLPGMRYHIQVRSKPDGTSLDGIWGPWSQAVAAETPHSSGEQPSPLQGCWQEQQGGTLGLQGVGVLLQARCNTQVLGDQGEAAPFLLPWLLPAQETSGCAAVLLTCGTCAASGAGTLQSPTAPTSSSTGRLQAGLAQGKGHGRHMALRQAHPRDLLCPNIPHWATCPCPALSCPTTTNLIPPHHISLATLYL